jgi:hypothetical protein
MAAQPRAFTRYAGCGLMPDIPDKKSRAMGGPVARLVLFNPAQRAPDSPIRSYAERGS